MPRPRTDIFWRERVRHLTEQNPGFSSRKIAGILAVEAGKLKDEGKRSLLDSPSEKTVRSIMAEHRSPEKAEERPLYRFVHWPESFGTSDLPWEAAAAVLETVRLVEEPRSPFERSRLTVRGAKWYWRITLACPTSTVHQRIEWARLLAASEAGGFELETLRYAEYQLLHPELQVPIPARGTLEAAVIEGIVSPEVAMGFLRSRDAESESREKEEGQE